MPSPTSSPWGAALGIAAGVAAGVGLVDSLAFAVVAGASAMLVAIDIAKHRSPHRIVLATFVAAVVSGRGADVPFGPSLVLGAVIAVTQDVFS